VEIKGKALLNLEENKKKNKIAAYIQIEARHFSLAFLKKLYDSTELVF